jgi:hypothetical protein
MYYNKYIDYEIKNFITYINCKKKWKYDYINFIPEYKNKYIDYEIKNFITYINCKKKWKYDYINFIPKYKFTHLYRCLGRIWDKDLNINKQCENSAYNDNILCNSCWNIKLSFGLVNEIPDKENILCYNKGVKNNLYRDIDRELDINNYNKLSKKKYTTKSNMKIKISSKKSVKIIVKRNKQNKQKKIEDRLELNDNIYNEWWNSNLTDKINIYDLENGTNAIFAMEKIKDTSYLLNKNQVIMGIYKTWEDSKNIIPSCFKNNINEVLHPKTAVPLNEYILYNNNKLYNEVRPGIYREYRYDIEKEELYFTNSIEY